MPHHITKGDPNIQQSLEQLLMRLLINPNSKSATITKLMDVSKDGTLSESFEKTTFNEDGTSEECQIGFRRS